MYIPFTSGVGRGVEGEGGSVCIYIDINWAKPLPTPKFYPDLNQTF